MHASADVYLKVPTRLPCDACAGCAGMQGQTIAPEDRSAYIKYLRDVVFGGMPMMAGRTTMHIRTRTGFPSCRFTCGSWVPPQTCSSHVENWSALLRHSLAFERWKGAVCSRVQSNNPILGGKYVSFSYHLEILVGFWLYGIDILLYSSHVCPRLLVVIPYMSVKGPGIDFP